MSVHLWHQQRSPGFDSWPVCGISHSCVWLFPRHAVPLAATSTLSWVVVRIDQIRVDPWLSIFSGRGSNRHQLRRRCEDPAVRGAEQHPPSFCVLTGLLELGWFSNDHILYVRLTWALRSSISSTRKHLNHPCAGESESCRSFPFSSELCLVGKRNSIPVQSKSGLL